MKTIQPLDPEALRKHVDEHGATPTVAQVDVNSVYRTPEPTTLRRPDVPPQSGEAGTIPAQSPAPAPTASGAASIYPTPTAGPHAGHPTGGPTPVAPAKDGRRVADRESGLKVYSWFIVAATILGVAFSIYVRLQVQHALPGVITPQFNNLLNTLTLLSTILPLAVAAFLLHTKSTAGAKVTLIILGILQAYRCVVEFSGLTHGPTLSGVFWLCVSFGVAVWTWNVYKDVSLLED